MTESKKAKKILFVCVGNACRSQMAEGFARHYGKGVIEVESAGTAAAGWIAPLTREVMSERGIDIEGQSSKQLIPKMIDEADMVITLGCCSADEMCPVTYHGAKIDWDIKDPIGRPIEEYRKARDDIERRVKDLIETLRQS